jgi:hypothetical protein
MSAIQPVVRASESWFFQSIRAVAGTTTEAIFTTAGSPAMGRPVIAPMHMKQLDIVGAVSAAGVGTNLVVTLYKNNSSVAGNAIFSITQSTAAVVDFNQTDTSVDNSGTDALVPGDDWSAVVTLGSGSATVVDLSIAVTWEYD